MIILNIAFLIFFAEHCIAFPALVSENEAPISFNLDFLPDRIELDDVVDYIYESEMVSAKLSYSNAVIRGANTVQLNGVVNSNLKSIIVNTSSPTEMSFSGVYSLKATQKSIENFAKDYNGAGVFKVHLIRPKISIVGIYEGEEDSILQFTDIQLNISFEKAIVEAENLKYGKNMDTVNWVEINTMLNEEEYDEMWENGLREIVRPRLMQILNKNLKDLEVTLADLRGYATAFAF